MTEQKYILLSGYFAYIVDSYKAQLESPLLPWKPFHQSVGLCLRFNYLMPAQSKSVLKVSLREPKLEKPVLVWRLVGYHGKEWSAAEVVWPGAKGVQVGKQYGFNVILIVVIFDWIAAAKGIHVLSH